MKNISPLAPVADRRFQEIIPIVADVAAAIKSATA
jgi:hypothetical protein